MDDVEDEITLRPLDPESDTETGPDEADVCHGPRVGWRKGKKTVGLVEECTNDGT